MGKRKPNKIRLLDFWRTKTIILSHTSWNMISIGEELKDGSVRTVFLRKHDLFKFFRLLSGNRHLRVCLAKRCEAFMMGMCRNEVMYAKCLQATKRLHTLEKQLNKIGRK